jgi:hypothetical protein
MQQSLEPLPQWGVGDQAQPRRQRRAQPAFELAQSIGGHSMECGTVAEGRWVSERDVECRTPDGRYLVVRGRLWRATNPHLSEKDKERLVGALMNARRQMRGQRSAENRAAAKAAVDAAKVALGERGPVWWKGRRARLQSAPSAQHALCGLVCRSQGVCVTVLAAGSVEWR